MAPPRQRPAPTTTTTLDDSRSEASSTRERQGAGAKGRKPGATGATNVTSKEAKASLPVAAAAGIPAGDQRMDGMGESLASAS
ncbi:hypothetical protein FQN49_007096, partial [Arthroderma sp. PD_2]